MLTGQDRVSANKTCFAFKKKNERNKSQNEMRVAAIHLCRVNINKRRNPSLHCSPPPVGRAVP